MQSDPWPFQLPGVSNVGGCGCFHLTPAPTPGAIVQDVIGVMVSRIDPAPVSFETGVIHGVWVEPQNFGTSILKFLIVSQGQFHIADSTQVRIGPYIPSVRSESEVPESD